MTSSLDTILDLLSDHFDSNGALPIIGTFGNRFEHWFKWECAVALQLAKQRGAAGWIDRIELEAEYDYDLLLRTDGSAPEVRLELKARSTPSRGPGELALAMMHDQGKLRAAVDAKGGVGASLALIIAGGNGGVDKWVAEIRSHKWLSEIRSGAPPIVSRSIPLSGGGPSLAALILLPV